MAEGMTCYERDEVFCEDQMCLRVGCRIRNERFAADSKMPAKIWAHPPASTKGCVISFTTPSRDYNVEFVRADLVEQMAADLDEGFQILGNLIDSIQRHGNYSPESTITFVDQARQCVRVAILRARQAADTEGRE